MKYVYVVVVAVFLLESCTTQTVEPAPQELTDDVDQLKKQLTDQPNNRTRLNLYYALYKAHRQFDTEAAYDYLSDHQKLAIQLGDHLASGKASYNMGLILKKKGDYIRAVELYLQSIHYFEKINEHSKIAVVLDNIGNIFAETGNYEYAKRFYNKTKDIHKENNDLQGLIIANLNLGISDYSTPDPDYISAEQHFEKALKYAELLPENRARNLNWIYNSLGSMNYKKGNYESAKNFYLKSLDHVDPKEDLNRLRFIAYSNIGETAMGTGDYSEAKLWIEKALSMELNNNLDQKLLIGNYNILGELYQRQNKHKEAVVFLEKAIEIANKTVVNPPLQESLRLVSSSYVALNAQGKVDNGAKVISALEILNKQVSLEDALIEQTNFKALQAALGLSVELDHQKKEKQAQIELKSMFISIAVLLAVAAIFIGYRLRSTKFELNQAGNRLRLIKHIAKNV